MQATQIDFLTSEGFKLYGLAYQPSKDKKLAIFIHGAGDSSVIRDGALLAALSSELSNKDIDLMTFNNRGSGYVSSIKKYSQSGQVIEKLMAGMAYERIVDCIADVDAAVDWALKNGYEEITLIGHSTGANKAVLYLSPQAGNSKNVVQVFLLGGGDDISLQNSRIKNPARYLKSVKSNIAKGNGNRLVPEDDFPGGHPITYSSLLEIIEENSDYDVFPFGRYKDHKNNLFSKIKSIKLPVVAIYGSEDFGTVITVTEAMKILKSINRNIETVVIEGADHGFTGMEVQLAKEIASRVI
ncbi:alpha/beta hydrolase [Candidatus Saccharibacteria bacterium]|nr:alpha/beta hydrolase [Candidatus Saccharibacteria bacterium]